MWSMLPSPPTRLGGRFLCLGLALVGVLAITPYFLYVLRFLVPRSIVVRLEREILFDLRRGSKTRTADELSEVLATTITNIQYLGKITLRSVERYDRDTASEGLQALKNVVRRLSSPQGISAAGVSERPL